MNTALVTGAAGIIGPSLCAALRQAGWKVAAADYEEKNFALYERIHGEPLPADLHLTGDLANRGDCIRLVESVSERLGPIGLLVNNATANSKRYPLAEMDEAACERLLRVDLMAPLFLSQAATAGLAETRGLIVNISSVMVENIFPGNLLYTIAKAGVEKMTQALAVELAPRGIRVNALRLGSIPGDAFLRPALELLPGALAKQLYDDIIPRHVQALEHATLTGRVGRPSDVGQMIVYLASPAGQYVNGAVLPVDGAYTLARQRLAASVPSGSPFVRPWSEQPRETLEKWLKEKGIDFEI